MAYPPPPQAAFYQPAHSAVLDPRLRNWSSWAQDAQAPVDPNVDPVAHVLQTPASQARPADLFPDEDPHPSFAPPAHPNYPSDAPDMLWSSPGSRPASRNNELFQQPVQQWPADIVSGYANILADPTTFTLPYGHRQQTAYTPAHKMSKGVHIDSSFDHGHGHGNHNHHSPPPLALLGPPPGQQAGPPGLLPPPGWDLAAGMESLALVPVVPPPAPRRPVELYHNNINSGPRPPSAPPALTEPFPPVDADNGPIAPSPAPPRQSAPSIPIHLPPPAQHYDFSQYMHSVPPPAAPPAPVPQPPTTASRAYSTGYGSGNHINASAAPRTPSPLPPPAAPAHGVTPKMVHEMDDAFYRPQYMYKSYGSGSSSSGQSSLGKSDKPLKGILQRTQYEDPSPPPKAWAGLWNEPAAYNPVVPPPLPQSSKQPRGMSERRRGNSVSAFETPASYQAGLHGYPTAAMGAAPTRKHAQSQSVSHGHHVIPPQDRLDAMLSGGFPPTQGHNAPTGTHPFFHEFTATPQQTKSGAMGSGGYPWYPQGTMDTPSTQLGETYVSGLYADEMPPSTKMFKGGNKDQQRAEKENHLLRSNSVTYGALPKTATAPPEQPVKDKSRRVSATSPFPDASMFGGAPHKPADHAAPTAPQSWYTSSSAPAPTPAPSAVGGGKIKKSKNKVQIQAPVTPAGPVITPILQKPNEAAQFYGQAVKFADDPIIKKKSKR